MPSFHFFLTVTSFTVAYLQSELMVPRCCMRQEHPHRKSPGLFSKKASICTPVINYNPVSSLKYCSLPTLFIHYYEFHCTFHLSYERTRLKNSLSTAIDFFFSWLAARVMIPAVISSIWFDSLHEMLLILSIPWCSLLLSEYHGQMWSQDFWSLTDFSLSCSLRHTDRIFLQPVSSLQEVWLKS